MEKVDSQVLQMERPQALTDNDGKEELETVQHIHLKINDGTHKCWLATRRNALPSRLPDANAFSTRCTMYPIVISTLFVERF
jgi:hypothetical protein